MNIRLAVYFLVYLWTFYKHCLPFYSTLFWLTKPNFVFELFYCHAIVVSLLSKFSDKIALLYTIDKFELKWSWGLVELDEFNSRFFVCDVEKFTIFNHFKIDSLKVMIVAYNGWLTCLFYFQSRGNITKKMCLLLVSPFTV